MHADASVNLQTRFNIQVCSKYGRLLSEYELTASQNNVTTLSAAQECARENLSDYRGEPLVIIVSEETLANLRQTQEIFVSRIAENA